MEVSDIVILVIAGFVAVSALVRLMLVRHNRLLGEARQRIDAERRRQAAEEAAAVVRRGGRRHDG